MLSGSCIVIVIFTQIWTMTLDQLLYERPIRHQDGKILKKSIWQLTNYNNSIFVGELVGLTKTQLQPQWAITRVSHYRILVVTE